MTMEVERKLNAIWNALRTEALDRLSGLSTLTGIVALQANSGFSSLTDGFDAIVIAVFEEQSPQSSISHYIKDGYRIQERRYAASFLESQIHNKDHGNIIYWIVQGEIWMDRQGYLEDLRNQLTALPDPVIEFKLFTEFSSFLRRYLQSKEYLQAGHILDAYSNVMEALHHWARIVLIEDGIHPDVTVWQQVRQVNAGVYKLYEELTTSGETLKQRIELVQLACDFSLMSKLEACCGPLLRVLADSEEPQGIADLACHELLHDFAPELPLLLNKLVSKLLIREVAVAVEDDLSFMEVKYTK